MSSAADNSVIARMDVKTPDGSYPLLLGDGLLARIGSVCADLKLGRTVVVATDTNVAPLYGEKVVGALQAEGFDASLATMQTGEANKRWSAVSAFVDAFANRRLARDGWVMALGGGVVGDTAGFAASVYMRGVRLVQVPTTLLAMADSSLGGKVGVDHEAGKNLIGAFKQPELVIAALETLVTLSELQIRCGLAEIAKAAVIGDHDLFVYLENTPPEEIDYRYILLRALQVKRAIVESDPYETGQRAYLNLGHTFGHAIESCTGYARPHGIAVAQGMAVAFSLAAALGICRPQAVGRIEGLLHKLGLPTRWGQPDLTGAEAIQDVIAVMAGDKKRHSGTLRLVLPETIGKVGLVSGTPTEDIREALSRCQ